MGASYDYGTGSGSDIDGNVKGMYIDYNGNITYASMRRSSSGYTYREAGGRLSQDINGSLDWETAVCASRDGRYLWWNNKRYYAPTKWGTGSVEYGTYS